MGKKFKNAPVYMTIGQVQHNPLLSLSSFLPEIQERMRKGGYPDFSRSAAVQFTIQAGEGSGEHTPHANMVERFLFFNIAQTSGFIIQANSLSFRTSEYDTFETFWAELEKGLDILNKAIGGLSFVERLGLRYLDAVAPIEGESLNEYLAPHVMGLPACMQDSKFLHTFSEAILVAENVGHVVSRTLIQNGPLGFPPDLPADGLKINARFQAIANEHAMIDTDGSNNERRAYDLEEIRTRMDDIHKQIAKCFHATVTDHARAAWDI
jgi:uncharacterized protein (TIGR04255 family)